MGHRVSWAIENKTIPEGQILMHKCDNPRCVNITHLITGTHKENTQDMIKKGRNRSQVGSNNHYAKLNNFDVVKIHQLRQQRVKLKEIAALFNVNQGTIESVIYRYNWKHIQPIPIEGPPPSLPPLPPTATTGRL